PPPPTRGFNVAGQQPAPTNSSTPQPAAQAGNAQGAPNPQPAAAGGRQQGVATAAPAGNAPQPQQAAGTPQQRGQRQGGQATNQGGAAGAAPQGQQQPPVTAGNEPPSRGGGSPKGGLTPLMYGARDGSLDGVKALVKAGAKLNEVSADNSSAVLLAVINGKFD